MKFAIKQSGKIGKHDEFPMAAVAVRGGSVLSFSGNLSRDSIYGLPLRGRHAEERTLKPHLDFTGATIYIARQGGRMSRPCRSCWETIERAGVSKVVYMDWDGKIVEERVG